MKQDADNCFSNILQPELLNISAVSLVADIFVLDFKCQLLSASARCIRDRCTIYSSKSLANRNIYLSCDLTYSECGQESIPKQQQSRVFCLQSWWFCLQSRMRLAEVQKSDWPPVTMWLIVSSLCISM